MLSKAIVIARDEEIIIPTINPLVDEINELMSYYKLKGISSNRQYPQHL